MRTTLRSAAAIGGAAIALSGIALASIALSGMALSNQPVAAATMAHPPVPPRNIAITTNTTTSHIEPYIAINPRDPANLLATARVKSRTEPGLGFIATYVSFDHGATWHDNGLLPQPAGFDFTADSTIAFTRDGTGYVAAEGQVNASANSGPGGVFVWRTTDGGRHFSQPLTVSVPGEATDHSWIATAPTRPRSPDAVYVVWNSKTAVRFTRSLDGGHTFQPPRTIAATTDPARAYATEVTAGGHGQVTVTYGVGASATTPTPRYTISSYDAGRTFDTSRQVGAEAGDYLLPDGLVESNLQAVATDPRTGQVYLAYFAARPDGHGTDIHLWHSTDHGRTWTGPQQVNTTSNDQTYNIQPNLAIGADGSPCISYFAVTNGMAVTVLAHPTTGGFHNQTLSTAPFDPRLSLLTFPNHPSRISLGDYQGLAIDHGNVYSLWNDTRDGGQAQLYLAAVTSAPGRTGTP